MKTRDIVLEAILGLLGAARDLVTVADDPGEAERILMEQAERNKQTLDRLRFGRSDEVDRQG